VRSARFDAASLIDIDTLADLVKSEFKTLNILLVNAVGAPRAV